MQLIVTRPEPAASTTAEKLRAMGHDVLISPMLEIVDTGSEIPEGNFYCIIITSSNALNMLAQRGIDNFRQNIPLYVVGDKTAELARKLGFLDVYSASGNANDLIKLLANQVDLSTSANRSALYICGADSTAGFIKSLQKTGLNLITWINYKAILVDQLTNETANLLRRGAPVGILLYSARTARQLSKLVMKITPDQAFDYIELFALSDNIRQSLGPALQNRCIVAQNPDQPSLFNLIRS